MSVSQPTMSDDGNKPDMIIGIDFGMTCTGVGYVNLSRSPVVRTIHRWPGRPQNNEDKVPTVMCYSRGSSQPSSWGFVSESELESLSPDKQYVEWFKTYLDEDFHRFAQKKDPQNCPDMRDVEKWYVDYLSQLYKHIKSKLGSIGELPSDKSWETATIEFIFSVPTTWRLPTTERFRSLIVKAGYNVQPRHSISVGFTEAEAAAVCVSIEAPALFQDDESILVCDVGGGTTDLTVLRISDTAGGGMTLNQLQVVQGRKIGSVKIDAAFEELMELRLREADHVQPIGVNAVETAYLLVKGREFQNAKCDFGSLDDPPLFSIPVPGLSPTYTNEDLHISQARIEFSIDELRALFDNQVRPLLDIIERQILRFQDQFPNRQISHLIISGGLGNSPYVQSCIKQRYANGVSNLSAVSNIQIHVASDPQLVVCKGIVIDRLRKLTMGKAVLGWRCCRASYGVVAKVLYRPKDPNHIGLPHIRDELNGKDYVANTIKWLIKKGEPVNTDTPIAYRLKRKLALSDNNRIFETKIVVSHDDAENLPSRLNEDLEVIALMSDFANVANNRFQLKRRRWWDFRNKYRLCAYVIKILIGPADINFELWFQGEKLSKDNPIKVEWQPASPPSSRGDGIEDEIFLDDPVVSKSHQIVFRNLAQTSVAMLSNISIPRNRIMGYGDSDRDS